MSFRFCEPREKDKSGTTVDRRVGTSSFLYTEGFKHRFLRPTLSHTPLRFVHETVFKEEAPARYHLQSPPPSCKQTRVGLSVLRW